MTKAAPLKDTQLFNPIKVGHNELLHRVVYAPTTRVRALDNHDPSDLQIKYYDDRTKTPGSLVISEATFIALSAAGAPNAPGIWSDVQARGWKAVNDKVHENGSFSCCQLWHMGRAAYGGYLKSQGQDYVAPSAIYGTEAQKTNAGDNPLRALTTEEVDDLIENVYPNAGRKADEAGFDYVELHAAHGYLLDSFIRPSSNKRTDKYGGSIENRARVVLDVVDKLSEILGSHRVAIRISPWTTFEGMEGYQEEVHPIATFGYLLLELQRRANEGRPIAYVSVVDPRVNGAADAKPDYENQLNDFVPLVWKGPIIKAGNYTYDAPEFTSLREDIANDRTLIAFSRFFTSNPDLAEKLREGRDLTPYDRATFYTNDNWGYNTFDGADYDEETEKKVLPKAIK